MADTTVQGTTPPTVERAVLTPSRIIAPLTVQLARGTGTLTWQRGDPDITLFEGDVASYATVRIAATAYTQGGGGLEIKVAEVADPAMPIILKESIAEANYQQMRTVLVTPGRRIRVYVWMDECPSGQVEIAWGVWGRTS